MQKIIALYYLYTVSPARIFNHTAYSLFTEALDLICQNYCLFFKPYQLKIVADTDDLPALNNIVHCYNLCLSFNEIKNIKLQYKSILLPELRFVLTFKVRPL